MLCLYKNKLSMNISCSSKKFMTVPIFTDHRYGTLSLYMCPVYAVSIVLVLEK